MNYVSDKEYKDRYGVTFSWRKLEDNKYEFVKEECFSCRYGMTEEETPRIDFFDPGGGPFVSLGTEIDGRKITNIRSGEDSIVVETD